MGSLSEKRERNERYKSLYSGLGKLKGRKITLHVKQGVKPVIQAARIPFSLRSKVEEKIAELDKLDIIERAEGPTSFVSLTVVVPKLNSSDTRLCVDMRQANEAIERERFPIRTIEETPLEVNGSKVFSKIDLKWGFHQLELSEESRPITTFATHMGLYRYKRLMFGVTSAPEIYRYTIHRVLRDCEGTRNMTDDIIIHANMTDGSRRFCPHCNRVG